MSTDLENNIKFLKDVEASLDLYCKYRCTWRECLIKGENNCCVGKTRKKILDEINETRKILHELQNEMNGKTKK